MHEQQIMLTLEALRVRMDERFDRVDDKFDTIEKRTQKLETEIVRIKTAGSVVGTILTFMGWAYIKPWLTSLMKS